MGGEYGEGPESENPADNWYQLSGDRVKFVCMVRGAVGTRAHRGKLNISWRSKGLGGTYGIWRGAMGQVAPRVCDKTDAVQRVGVVRRHGGRVAGAEPCACGSKGQGNTLELGHGGPVLKGGLGQWGKGTVRRRVQC